MFNAKLSLPDARMAIVGLGLMGGSLAAACKQKRLCREVVGIARRQPTVDEALAMQAVDWATTDLAQGITGADIIVLATPVRTIIDLIQKMADLNLPPCLVLDMGSTQSHIVKAMELLPAHVDAVASHPMCGKETAGLSADEPGLFEGAPWIITPLPRSSPRALALTHELVQAVGAIPLVLEAQRHDRLVAAISHLPYLLAVSLVLAACDLANEDDQVWTLAASGFRDTSRVAASDIKMMVDILMTNREAVLNELVKATGHLDRLAQAIGNGNEDELRSLLESARNQRASMHFE